MPVINHPGLYLLSFLNVLLSTAATQNLPPYNPTDLILLNCGASSIATSMDGRKWDGDALSKFLASNSQTASSALTASEQDPSVTQVPYMTARIIHSKFTYMFPVLPGPKFVRLYFYPATYSNFNISKSFFSLKANNYTLLNNFSASLTVSAISPPVASLIKEFIVTVWENQKLNLTFSPSPTSFAFINGIEIVSMPNILYAKGNDNPLNYVGIDYPFYLGNTTALETVYRLNVGGRDINGVDDTGMYRTWHQDKNYLYGAASGLTAMPRDKIIKYTLDTPAYTAPELVYGTFRSMGSHPDINMNYNLTWLFSVDAGFNYLVRLHFCETRLEITKVNQEVFFIFINNQTAEIDADVISWSGGNSIPVYKDYVAWVPEGSQSKQDLWLALHPRTDVAPEFADAILNGMEIFKLNKSDGNLAGPNPEPKEVPTPSEQHQMVQERTRAKDSSLIAVVLGAVFGGIFVLSSILCFFVFKRQMRATDFHKSEAKSTSISDTQNASLLPTSLCHRFSFSEIEVATGKFEDELIIGSGGFGNVYKGYIDDGTIPVAIKRLHSSSGQGKQEFITEIDLLSKLRHIHLVSLIGYCDDHGEMILVYEYIHRGTLRDHLYKTQGPSLPWKQRLQICIGAAKGLHYLHSGAEHTVIHRDVKTTNILVDQNWVAKVSDFGLSRLGPTGVSQTHVSTLVKGSFGYIDPEYYRRLVLIEKSDVYSFGVVLFEVLCARPPVITRLLPEEPAVNLAQWVQDCYRKGIPLDQIIDPRLRGDIAAESLKKFGEIAYSCIHDRGMERPTMGDVVWALEFALQLQETAVKNIIGDDSVNEGETSALGEGITIDDHEFFRGSGEPMFNLLSKVSTHG